ncbi:MAG TPA: alpha/beta fold hydrolase [Puia sp.]|jgi:pimeloyl-ACP methyl ester carboxylesterase|nr:alpha/beta fold hydrolase [Puia sp.]
MPSAFSTFGASRIHYSFWGTGDRLLLCFHGYGESAASFAFLEERLGPDLTILAIDLPFHGDTDWRQGYDLDPHDLLHILQDIIARLPHPSEEWWMLGYSMGGRVALQLLQLAPDKIRQLILFAPDGLRMNPWYWLATQTAPGNRLFRWTMKHPAWLFFLLRTGHALHLVNPSVYKFTAHYVNDRRVRMELYARWTNMRNFRPRLRKLSALIREHHIPVKLFYGSYDRIIRWQRGERFRKRTGPCCQLSLLPAGHQLLQPKFLEVIAKALNLTPN